MSVVFNVLKNDKVGAKQLFCYSPKAKLNAIDVKNLFVTVISKEKEREIFNHWTNYLNCLESKLNPFELFFIFTEGLKKAE